MDSQPGERNLKQVAAVLGVHYMTAYRYVRTGRLPARRVGTGWVVDAHELETFAARPRPVTSPSGTASTGRTGSTGRAGDDRRERLASTLAIGDETAAWRILEQALAAGLPPAECYLDLVVGAIDDLSGRSWRPDVQVAQEYLAVATATRLVARLGARFRRPGRSRGTVIFGAPLGEHHTLPIAIVADLVRLEGYSCLELGANVPPQAFAGAATDAYRLIAVGIGMTTAASVDAVRATVLAVRKVGTTIPIVLGGQAATASTGAVTGADAWATDGRQAIEIIGGLARSRRSLQPLEESADAADDAATDAATAG